MSQPLPPLGARRGALPATGRTLAVVACATLVLAGCSSTGGRAAAQRAEASARALAAGSAGTPEITVAMVTHSGPGDTFWDVVRKGAQTAAAKDNVKLLYSADPDAARQAQLVQQALDQDVDGIVTTLAKPDAMKGVLAEAAERGIPVVVVNGGGDIYAATGAIAEFGQDERVAGEAAGTQLDAVGATKVLCVVHEQGNVGHDDRCRGAESTFTGTLTDLFVDGADIAQSTATITSALQTDPDVDAVLTLGAPYATAAVTARRDAGSDAKVATFDMDSSVVAGLRSGDLAFAIDQQPFLQGYSGVDALWLHQVNGTVLGGGKAVLTGPAVVTPDDVDTVAAAVEAGTR